MNEFNRRIIDILIYNDNCVCVLCVKYVYLRMKLLSLVKIRLFPRSDVVEPAPLCPIPAVKIFGIGFM